jgi:hypothetical protein
MFSWLLGRKEVLMEDSSEVVIICFFGFGFGFGQAFWNFSWSLLDGVYV